MHGVKIIEVDQWRSNHFINGIQV